jgi:hypothetical protein
MSALPDLQRPNLTDSSRGSALRTIETQVVGGRVFGYNNRKITDGTGVHGNDRYSHTVREVDKKEAAVVRRIFQLYASGLGGKAIAKRLNNEGAIAPKPFIRRDPTKAPPLRGWSHTTVRTILCRELYRGVVVWNRSRKRDDWRQVHQQPRLESEWIRPPRERRPPDCVRRPVGEGALTASGHGG